MDCVIFRLLFSLDWFIVVRFGDVVVNLGHVIVIINGSVQVTYDHGGHLWGKHNMLGAQ